MDNLISIILPVFNREKLLAEAVDSVISQTYPNWELIIVDDGSTNNTFKIAEAYQQKDSRIKAIKRDRTPKNANTCRNIGAEYASGNYLMFLDSDDLLRPTCLEIRMQNISKHPEISYFLYRVKWSDSYLVNVPTNIPLVYKKYLKNNIPFQTTSLLIKKDAFGSIGGFDENLQRIQDPDLYMRLLPTQTLTGKAFDIVDVIYRSDLKHSERKRNGNYNSIQSEAICHYIDKHLLLLTPNSKNRQLFGWTIRSMFLRILFSLPIHKNPYIKQYVRIIQKHLTRSEKIYLILNGFRDGILLKKVSRNSVRILKQTIRKDEI